MFPLVYVLSDAQREGGQTVTSADFHNEKYSTFPAVVM